MNGKISRITTNKIEIGCITFKLVEEKYATRKNQHENKISKQERKKVNEANTKHKVEWQEVVKDFGTKPKTNN